MEVKILELDNSSDLATRVSFSSAVGQAWAFWLGDAPMVGDIYQVELATNESLYWEEDFETVVGQLPLIEMDGDSIVVQGLLEQCEDDGFTVLSFGAGNLSLNVYGNPPVIGTLVRTRLKNLTLSDNRI